MQRKKGTFMQSRKRESQIMAEGNKVGNNMSPKVNKALTDTVRRKGKTKRQRRIASGRIRDAVYNLNQHQTPRVTADVHLLLPSSYSCQAVQKPNRASRKKNSVCESDQS